MVWGVVFSFVWVLVCVLMLLCLFGLHVVGAVNITCRVAPWRVDDVADTKAPAILEDTARRFPADVALARCLMMDAKVTG